MQGPTPPAQPLSHKAELSPEVGTTSQEEMTTAVALVAKPEKRQQPPMVSFLWEFVKSPLKTGALIPSSQGLARSIVENAALDDLDTVVELGSGTGVFTEQIQKRRKPDSVFFALEINAEFAQLTRERCPGVIVYNDSATEILTYLKQHGRKQTDCIVSSLPWTFFDDALQRELVEEIVKALPEGGSFLTFAYLHGLYLPSGRRFRRLLETHFSHVETRDIQWKNVPPALIYLCKK